MKIPSQLTGPAGAKLYLLHKRGCRASALAAGIQAECSGGVNAAFQAMPACRTACRFVDHVIVTA